MHPDPSPRPSLARNPVTRWGLLTLLCLLVLGACLVVIGTSRPATATAAPNLEVGLFDDAYLGPEREHWLERTADAGAGSVRIPVRWKFIASQPPTNATQPDDPAYSFFAVDQAVETAIANGLQPVLTLTTAPAWAERGQRPAGIKQEGAWNPDPAAFGEFARAVATRYSGSHDDLPRVSMYEAWNEPNYGLTHLAPQWRNGKPYGVELYRQLLNEMYDGVKGVHQSNKVIAPSLGPQGRTPNRSGSSSAELAGVRPLFFLRELFCLRHDRKMTPRSCPGGVRPRFDILSHHPINPTGPPGAKASHPDSVIGGDIGKLRRTLATAEKAGNLIPVGKRAIWVTEFWWETNPPNRRYGVKPMKQARNIAEALYVFWRAGVQRAFGFRIRDTATGGNDNHGGASGLYDAAGRPKPSLTAFRFPFVGDRRSKRKILAWGKAPATGRLTIEQKQGGWKAVKRIQVNRGDVFTVNLRLRGKRKLRASIGGRQSLSWTVKKK